MSGTRLSDLPRAIVLRLKHGDWRGLYTRPSKVDPDRYTDEVKAVLKRADEEVRARGNEVLGTQHLFLGLLLAGGTEVNDMFARAGASLAPVVQEIDRRVLKGDLVWDPLRPVESGETPTRPRFVGMTRRTIDAQERVFRLLDQRDIPAVTPSLLLEALIADRHATATRLLREAGVNIRALKRAADEAA
jgi:ATP-dependent Clp protease ATP-binding subunit ClpA